MLMEALALGKPRLCEPRCLRYSLSQLVCADHPCLLAPHHHHFSPAPLLQRCTAPPTTRAPTLPTSSMPPPLLFPLPGWFSLNVPSGLTLYWFANNIITTAQQAYLRSKFQAPELAPAAVGGTIVKPKDEEEEEKRPSGGWVWWLWWGGALCNVRSLHGMASCCLSC